MNTHYKSRYPKSPDPSSIGGIQGTEDAAAAALPSCDLGGTKIPQGPKYLYSSM